MSGTLVTVHQALHAALREALEEALVAATEATAAGLERASGHWDRVTATVMVHAADEEEALATLGTAAPRGGDATLVVAEHRKLEVLLGEGRAALGRIGATSNDRRRALVRELDVLLRAVHLFEHHTRREEQIVYPHLAGATGLDPEVSDRLARRIAERTANLVSTQSRADGAVAPD